MDASTLAILAAAGVGVVAGMAWLTLPRGEDYFERSMAELLDLTTASGSSHPAPLAGGQDTTAGHHQPECGLRDVVECPASPPTISDSSRVLLSGSMTDGAAVWPTGSGPVFLSLIDGGGPAVPRQRDRPALFRVK